MFVNSTTGFSTDEHSPDSICEWYLHDFLNWTFLGLLLKKNCKKLIHFNAHCYVSCYWSGKMKQSLLLKMVRDCIISLSIAARMKGVCDIGILTPVIQIILEPLFWQNFLILISDQNKIMELIIWNLWRIRG